MRRIILLAAFWVPLTVYSQTQDQSKARDSILLLGYFEKLNHTDLYSQDRQKYLDSILLIRPKAAYIWQQKAMPLFKQKKYSIGMAYLDKAVEYDTTGHWLEYRAFIKCIFQKDYQSAIADFSAAKQRNGFGFVMDHSYDFYTGLSYLQLNEFSKAANYIQTSIDYRVNKMNGAHYLENFYLGIVQMEMGQLDKAISLFDAALNDYSHFSDAKFYKAQCLLKSRKLDIATELFKEALKDLEKGFTINEDNVIYETYPYQVSKAWLAAIVKSFEK